MKRLGLGLGLAAIGALALITHWLGELLADAEDVWS